MDVLQLQYYAKLSDYGKERVKIQRGGICKAKGYKPKKTGESEEAAKGDKATERGETTENGEATKREKTAESSENFKP